MYSADIIRDIIFSFIMYFILRFRNSFGVVILSGLVVGSILIDLIGVGNRYLDSELFINEDQTYFTENQKDIEILNDKYVNIVIETISIALPVCIKAVPAKTKTKSG